MLPHSRMTRIRVYSVFVAALLVFEFGNCEDVDLRAPKETYVSSIEKAILFFMRTGRVLEREITSIEEKLEQAASHIPFLKNPQERKRTTVSDVLNPHKSKIKAILPGTYWCGGGDAAPNKEDLGLFKKTDACCRGHDSCQGGIPAQEERDGLINNGIFTRSPCECDATFYHCLKEARTIIATDIGLTYFNLLRLQCFKKYYPIVGCKKYSERRVKDKKCEEYNYNVTQPKVLEWFDNPDFK